LTTRDVPAAAKNREIVSPVFGARFAPLADMLVNGSQSPVVADGPSTGLDSEGELPTRPAEPPLVLLVEDEQNAREGMTEFLVAHGFRVTDAKDGLEALRKAEVFQPDVVLLDLAIPKMDGWAVARQLRSDPKYRGVPVVAVSAMDYPDEVNRALEAGCVAFLAKPCDLRRLVPTLEQVIGK
jgi:CheY-like chemotaxis protein